MHKGVFISHALLSFMPGVKNQHYVLPMRLTEECNLMITGSLNWEEPVILSEIQLSLEPDGIQNLMNHGFQAQLQALKMSFL